MKITLYHYKPLETLNHFSQLRNYMDQKIWFTRLDQFNDPFESHFIYQYASLEEHLSCDYLASRYCRDLNQDSEEWRIALSSPEASKVFGKKKISTELFKNHGAICFTSDPDNIPMWAHYANNHRGYCVIFEIDLSGFGDAENDHMSKVMSGDEILTFRNIVSDTDMRYIFTKVKYLSRNRKPTVEEKIHVFYLEKQGPEKLGVESYEWNKYFTQHSFGAKCELWSYENEYRLVVNANSVEAGLMNLRGYYGKKNKSFIKVIGVIMGQNIGKNISEDAKTFILSNELSGYKFTSSNLDDKVKEYIASMANQYNIKLYLSKCSRNDEEYK